MDFPVQENDPAGIIIFAESGLLAGDLAALLSARFQVTRASSLGAATQALQDGARALIIVDGPGFVGSEPLKNLASTALVAGVQVLVLGADPPRLSSPLAGKFTILPSVPGPGVILAALGQEHLLGHRAES